MPRENRKRGKKHKKEPEQHEEPFVEPHKLLEESSQPSWIKPVQVAEEDPAAPFGYVDADVKAYFRSVDLQIRGWTETDEVEEEAAEDHDPNEDKRMFFVAALQEMSGKEKQLATDPDCSTILERMTYSMDDFVRRVFVDSLSGSYEALVKHRFASHVCQTLFTVAGDTISRECRGVIASPSDEGSSDNLRTMSQLILDAAEELTPSFATLIMDPFASHALRALLILLCPTILPSSQSQSSSNSNLRSRKSSAWRSRQGPMKSVFAGDQQETHVHKGGVRQVPPSFSDSADQLLHVVRRKLSENEVRALAADKVASPLLQLLLELEDERGQADESNSLMDRVLVGLITSVHKAPGELPPASDYLATLLRDPTSSHLLETLVSRSPPAVFVLLYKTYLSGKLARLAAHPIANFVIARALARADSDVFSEALEELTPTLGKIIKAARTGVVRALIDRAAAIKQDERQLIEALCVAFDLNSSSAEDRRLFVPCVLRLKTKSEYLATAASGARAQDAMIDDMPSQKKGRKAGLPQSDPLAPTTQGSVLLQAILRLSEPHNGIVVDSIQNMSIDDLIALSHDTTSSRVLDELLDSPSVPKQAKRKLTLSFIGHFHRLVDDRIGSRVGDRLWASSDPYLKEKIGRSLFAHENDLAASFYGKFFARNLNLHLLRRNADEWKNRLARPAAQASEPQPPPPKQADRLIEDSKKTKKRRQGDDEIDNLFDDAGLSKRTKRGALEAEGVAPEDSQEVDAKMDQPTTNKADRGLVDVLGAIKLAPKGESVGKVKKGKKNRT